LGIFLSIIKNLEKMGVKREREEERVIKERWREMG
jgi:hypothetical protein